MDLGLAGSRVVVTGGASNIGRAIVHEFASEGARIVLNDIDEPQAKRVRDEALERGAGDVEVSMADLTTPDGAESAVGRALDCWGGVDVLINNAGWSVPGFVATDTDRAKWQRTIEINLFSAIAATQAAIGPMKDNGGGAIVFISSEAAFGQIRQAVYGASKAAMVALARTTAREHGRHGIRSNIVCPGLVIPDGPEAVGQSSLWSVGQDNVFNEKQIDFMLKDTPLRRLTNAEDVARAALWFASPLASRQVTGQLISVSGGYTMP
ncbi:oxidoreductase, short chain dehydrogenase/reductase [Mycobacteroides abscessus subsp. abscessus]|uniref:Oxidoreductase, short chain dehydrogenase/reductase n=1 Tax=Mycobacteroides abscessus TaxID=36809 RepID=A0A0U0ZRV4_9MYCO|nr:SDR family oxidoreductase [Mycobacteroides abscessus]MBL3736012.1 SDR family oxidoreductase [Mycobacteroides abscessus subsp. massiliense]MBL3746492.1 SDR family oxidoreductase [Mycobacteroides abscessus subsp. massiliense]MBL3760694.1 SDR family oxidoreductase [Mycobacteroides abscessus subsp. massiliense]MBN7483331.1 SDR family oxidoreductase [Mycobacteroides abscessus subsp. massiliense]MDB2217448.1 SDR family NAD(P)-dependent oxidoreductase [Mycobacteroides abscessus subsp. massiliense]